MRSVSCQLSHDCLLELHEISPESRSRPEMVRLVSNGLEAFLKA